MSEAPYALALAAGLVAAFNPCGFALLPAYLTLLVADGDESGRLSAVWRALRMTGAMTVGFVGVFGLFGLIVTPLALEIERYLPWVTIVVGILLVGLGGWLLSGRQLTIGMPKLGRRGQVTRGLGSMLGYGISYALASLSCTVGPFLALVVSTFRTSDLVSGVGVFIAYGLGMGLVVGVLAMVVALARTAVVARTRRVLPYVSRASGALLFVAGGYVAYYGWYDVRVLRGDSAALNDPVVGFMREAEGAVSDLLDRVGAGTVAVVFGVLVAVVAALSLLTRRRAASRKAGDTRTDAGKYTGKSTAEETRQPVKDTHGSR